MRLNINLLQLDLSCIGSRKQCRYGCEGLCWELRKAQQEQWGACSAGLLLLPRDASCRCKAMQGKAAFLRVQPQWSLESTSGAAPNPPLGKCCQERCCTSWPWPTQGAMNPTQSRITVIWRIWRFNELEKWCVGWCAHKVVLSVPVIDWLAFWFCYSLGTWPVAYRRGDDNLTSGVLPHQSSQCTVPNTKCN